MRLRFLIFWIYDFDISLGSERIYLVSERLARVEISWDWCSGFWVFWLGAK